MEVTALRWSTGAERQRIQNIIDRHKNGRPSGVRRLTFDFGEDHTGYPALYLTLFVEKNLRPSKEYIGILNDYIQVLINDVLNEDVDYIPYIRTFEDE